MQLLVRIFWLLAIWAVTSVAWLTLGGVMGARTSAQESDLYGKVADLWGASQQQAAPQLTFHWQTEHVATERIKDEETGRIVEKQRLVVEAHTQPVHLSASDIQVGLSLDQRRKGLLWFPLYDVDFSAQYAYNHHADQAGSLEIVFPFPDVSGLYDDFRFTVDGLIDPELQPENGAIRAWIPVIPGQSLTIHTGYRSRGMNEWSYRPTDQVAALNDFSLTMTTDFADIDFPAYTLSPSTRQAGGTGGGGWTLGWTFDRVVTGHGIGMVMPKNVQPGPLAEQMAFSAPISLGFFFLILFVLSVLRKIEIHPINYALLAGAFFAFHLLFSYSTDHLPVEGAFALASAVSVGLVVSYLRLVVSSRFAFGPAAAAQLVYLIGFSLAHFWEGYTGLTVTILSIITLFALMQLTGRVSWEEEFRKARRDLAVK